MADWHMACRMSRHRLCMEALYWDSHAEAWSLKQKEYPGWILIAAKMWILGWYESHVAATWGLLYSQSPHWGDKYLYTCSGLSEPQFHCGLSVNSLPCNSNEVYHTTGTFFHTTTRTDMCAHTHTYIAPVFWHQDLSLNTKSILKGKFPITTAITLAPVL